MLPSGPTPISMQSALTAMTLTSGAPAAASSLSGGSSTAQVLVLAADSSFASERTLALGAGLAGVDAGAGSTYTLSVDATVARNTWGVAAGVGMAGGGNLAAAGITLNVDQTYAFAWSGNQTWAGTVAFNSTVSSSLIPTTTDTYTLGSSSKMWSKGWLSELDAVLFAKNTISVVGGWMLVAKNSGILPAASGTGTTVNFGMAMVLNQFVIFRAAGLVEYMQVGTLVSGTTYNVTRNLSGVGAVNWVAGTVFVVLGVSGDGRIELNANATPRISIFSQGATYNVNTELFRAGDMNGWGAAVTELYGFGVGDYAGGNYLTYDTGGGFVLKAGGGIVLLDVSGVSIAGGAATQSKIKFLTAVGGTVSSYITENGAGSLSVLAGTSALPGQINLQVAGAGGIFTNLAITTAGGAHLSQGSGASASMTIDGGLNVGTATGAGTGVVSAQITDAGTNTAPSVLIMDHESSGTPVAGFGMAVSYQAKSATVANRSMALDNMWWTVATDASRTTHREISMYDTAARLVLTMEADGAKARLGFYGHAAVVQPAAPVTLADVIAVIRGCGLSA